MNVWYAVVAFGLMIIVFGWILKHFALNGLEYRRQFSNNTFFEGEHAEMIEIVRNDRPLLLPWMRVESRLPSSFRFGKQENLSVSGNMYHRSVFCLMPFQQITRRHHITLTHRGAYNLGNATLTTGDLLGAMEAHR